MYYEISVADTRAQHLRFLTIVYSIRPARCYKAKILHDQKYGCTSGLQCLLVVVILDISNSHIIARKYYYTIYIIVSKGMPGINNKDVE